MTYPDSQPTSSAQAARIASLSESLVAMLSQMAGGSSSPPADLFAPLLSALAIDLAGTRHLSSLSLDCENSALGAGRDFARLIRGGGLGCDQSIAFICALRGRLGQLDQPEVSVSDRNPSVITSLYFDQFLRGAAVEAARLETVAFHRKLREANRFVLQERRRYFSIFKRMAEPAFIVDHDLRLIETNRAFDGFFQVSGREHIGEECYQVLGEEFRAACDLYDVLHGHGGVDIEIDISVAGEPRSIVVNGTFLGDINHEAVGGIVIIQDITARRQVEQVLRERERHFRSLIETMPDVSWRADQNGDLVYVSPNATRIYGYPAHLLERDASIRRQAIHPDDCDLVRNAYCRFFIASLPEEIDLSRSFCRGVDHGWAGDEPASPVYDVKYRFRREDGIWVWIHERASHVEEVDGIWCANGVASDITALKMAEAELERHHFRLAELVDERTAELLHANLQLNREINIRRQTEKALVELTTRLSASNRELDQFAHVASHELKEPLMLIKAFSERLAKKYLSCLDAKGREYLARINGAVDHMRQLVDGFLTLSQVTSGAQPYEEFDLSELVREVVRDLEERVAESHALIEIGRLGRMGGDRIQMRQLFQNIIANALKYRKPDSPPRVILQGGLVENDTYYEIMIQDNGIGFDPQDADRIFKPLERLHSRRDYEGTGMGLTTCQKIVARHGGEIRAQGAIGKGATFIIRLPAELLR